MNDQIQIYIGYDRDESVAYHVLSHSLLSRSSRPLSITPLARNTLAGSFSRPRAEKDSTDFSNSRWIIPHLQHYQGWAIFMDCDMLCLSDIAGLWAQRSERYAVMCVQHDHKPEEDTKFLGVKQYPYERKNWSSLMLINCARCTRLTRRYVNSAPALELHKFRWLDDADIGSLRGDWNHLVGYDETRGKPDMVHFTSGGPWHGFNDIPFAADWWDELNDMLKGDNPVDYST